MFKWCRLDYKGNDNIQMVVEDKIPTDGVILKGWYSAITIALYGCLTTVTRERASPPPPPPPRSKAGQGELEVSILFLAVLIP